MRATFVLVPGAGGVAWYWHRVVPLLQAAGHDAAAVDLPGDDERAGLATYTDRVIEAIGAHEDVVLVAQSLGGFTAPLVCARARVRMLVLVNAMIPVPGETAGEWWEHTGSTAARTAAARRVGYRTSFDLETYFLHDVPPEIVARGETHQREESGIVFSEPCRFDAWPDVPIHVVAGRDDRFFPIDFQRQVARERLHAHVDELPGGHLIALSNPRGLADRLLAYLRHGPDDLLREWFRDPERWWKRDAAFDDHLRATYREDVEAAIRGELDGWASTPRGALALVILLDQIVRNIYRGTRRMYAGDEKAVAICLAAIERGIDASFSDDERLFLYMPLMHSEDRVLQERSLKKFRELGEGLEYAEHHAQIVFRFGRFPHRNAVLGRDSTPEEVEFLKQPGSSYY